MGEESHLNKLEKSAILLRGLRIVLSSISRSDRAIMTRLQLHDHDLVYDHFTVSLPQGRGVVGDDHELGLALTKGLQRLLVAQNVFAGLHHQSQPGVDGLRGLLLFLLCTHFNLKNHERLKHARLSDSGTKGKRRKRKLSSCHTKTRADVIAYLIL